MMMEPVFSVVRSFFIYVLKHWKVRRTVSMQEEVRKTTSRQDRGEKTWVKGETACKGVCSNARYQGKWACQFMKTHI